MLQIPSDEEKRKLIKAFNKDQESYTVLDEVPKSKQIKAPTKEATQTEPKKEATQPEKRRNKPGADKGGDDTDQLHGRGGQLQEHPATL